MVWKRKFNGTRYRTSRDPEYYHRLLERKGMDTPSFSTPTVKAPIIKQLLETPKVAEKKKPGRKKKVIEPRPITREQKEVIVYFQ